MIQYSFLLESTISELVKDSEWQQLRSSLVGTWKTKADENCKKLRSYLGSPLSNTSDSKLKIVWNYLSSSAFRIGIIQHPCIQKLKSDIRNEIKSRNIKFR